MITGAGLSDFLWTLTPIFNLCHYSLIVVFVLVQRFNFRLYRGGFGAKKISLRGAQHTADAYTYTVYKRINNKPSPPLEESFELSFYCVM